MIDLITDSRKIKEGDTFISIRNVDRNTELRNVRANNKLERLIEASIVTFMNQNRIDMRYYDYIYDKYMSDWISFEDYYGTFVESVNENDIELTEEDIDLANQYVKRGIVCCAFEIGSYLLNGEFESDVSMIKLNEMAQHPHQEFIHGKPLDPDLTLHFVKSLIAKMLEKLAKEKLTKLEVIAVLGPESFPSIAGKEYKPSRHIDGYYMTSIDYEASGIIRQCLKDINLENVYFSKNANKRTFKIKDGEFGYTSMNNGRWMPQTYIKTDEDTVNYMIQTGIEFKTAQKDDRSDNIEPGRHM